jgi:3-mercaptopyruvate sulfurtransferase SseA
MYFFALKATPLHTIVYCGSGVTACPNVLALREAGFTRVKLYAGLHTVGKFKAGILLRASRP